MNIVKYIGAQEQIDSIEAGKDADFVIWSGHLFDLKQGRKSIY